MADEEYNLAKEMNNMDLDDIDRDLHDPATSDGNINGNEGEDGLDLPTVLIITNVDGSVFNEIDAKNTFENAFKEHRLAEFCYLKNFRRARIEYNSSLEAAKARISLHETELCGTRIKCYFGQPKEKSTPGSPHLQLPAPEKQFLISPPASPPVGWEPVLEAEPVINYDLLSAIATLTPGEAHELHPATDTTPGIVVHISENPDGFENRPKMIQQTRRPPPE